MAVDEKLEAHQLTDQKLEAEFERCTERYQQWQKQYPVSMWQNLMNWLPSMGARRQRLAAQFFQDYLKAPKESEIQISAEQRIIEKIRKIKVARTKIHTELVDLSQWFTSKNGTQKRWLEWLERNQLDSAESSWAMSASLLKYQRPEWVKVLSIEGALKPDSSIAGLEIDYLLIDNADKITPAKIVPLLAQAKTALFLGKDIELPIWACMSPVYDNEILKACHLAETEEELEDLSYRGIHASGSAFCVAKAVKTTNYELRLSAIAKPPLSVQAISVSGESQAIDFSFCRYQRGSGCFRLDL